MTTGFVWHELFAWFDLGSAAAWLPPSLTVEPSTHVDAPGTRRRIRNLLEVSGLLDHLTAIKPREASRDELLLHHTPQYLDMLIEDSGGRGGDAGELSPFGNGGFDIAALAVGGCLAAVEAVVAGSVQNAYALVRPCGHHVEPSRGRGHGLLANVALTALHARTAPGINRIAIVDWDAHHGNGTEDAFYENPDVLTISIHQDKGYPPDRGTTEEYGRGAGVGKNINIPLPPASGPAAYLYAFDEVVIPTIRDHEPELIIVASGLDASQLDPNARMMLTSEAYRQMTRRIMQVAAETAGGRIVMCHEGGYSEPYVPFCGLAILEELSGERTAVMDPYLAALEASDLGLLPHQKAAIDRVITTHPALH